MKRRELIEFYQYLIKNGDFNKDAATDSHMFRRVDNFIVSKESKIVCGFIFTGYRSPCYMNKSHTCQNCEYKKENK